MTTSRRNASSVEMSDPVVTASYAPSDDASIGTSFMKSGSVYAKLFAKKAQVDVVETVEIHQNGLDEAHDVQPHGHDEMKHEGTSNGGIVRAKSVVEDEGGDEDDDEEYMPSEDGDSASEDEDTSDLEDEEMSMRGLLMPMATYARHLVQQRKFRVLGPLSLLGLTFFVVSSACISLACLSRRLIDPLCHGVVVWRTHRLQLRRMMPAVVRPTKVPGSTILICIMLLPTTGVFFYILVTAVQDWVSAIVLGSLVLLGLVYGFHQRQRARQPRTHQLVTGLDGSF